MIPPTNITMTIKLIHCPNQVSKNRFVDSNKVSKIKIGTKASKTDKAILESTIRNAANAVSRPPKSHTAIAVKLVGICAIRPRYYWLLLFP